MNTSTSWTNEQRELLRTLWLTPITATEIGTQCGDKTKGSVIGMANRMQLGAKKKTTQTPKVLIAKANIRLVPKAESLPAPIVVFVPPVLVSIDDLGPGMCRWPFGDPCSEDFRYCGCNSHGRPFCHEHDRIAYGERRPKPGKELPPLRPRRFGFR